jgi:tRNA1Val (adenine37-N6)-methyltransferase
MDDYFQPDFYRFNQDSLILVRWILDQKISYKSILDLGAGSGVIGIELARQMHPEKLVLVEYQKEFIPFLQKNCQTFLPKNIQSEIVRSAFSELQTHQTFDLIVCNPPYYLPGKGQESKLPERAIARSFIKDDWKILLNTIEIYLAPQGLAFLVVKNDPMILKEVEKAYSNQLKLQQHQLNDLIILELSTLNIN